MTPKSGLNALIVDTVPESTLAAFITGIPSRSAVKATGDGVRIRLRPIGASGRVRTATTSSPPATMAARVASALAGVPAKTILKPNLSKF
jgi:hypothetical protein